MGGRVKDEESASRNAAEHTPQTGPRAEMSAALAGVGLVATVGVPVFINYWIVRIRWEYMEAFPEAAKPPTISRAMSDIPLGAQMGTWLSICAVLMVIGAGIVSLLYVRTARALPCSERQRRRLALMGLGIVAIQVPVSIGMVVQAVYSLSVNNDLHMFGSYLLFISAALGQIVSIIACSAILRHAEASPAPDSHGLIHPTAARVRNWFAGVALLLVIFYLFLFIAKDTSLSSDWLYETYVTVEIMVIAAFMAYLMFHGVEFVRILWRHGRSAAASRKPASPAEGR